MAGYARPPVVNLPQSEVRARIRYVIPRLLRGEAVNSSAIRVSWTVSLKFELYFFSNRTVINAELFIMLKMTEFFIYA